METKVKAVELRELWRRYKQDGDERARERLVVAYSPLVKFVAGRMASGLPSHVEEADLISYGLLGLIGAIERFEPDREIKFETFAVAARSRARSSTSCARWTGCRARSRPKARDVEQAHPKLENKLRRSADRRGDGRRARDDRRGVPRRPARDRQLLGPRARRPLDGRRPRGRRGQVSLLDTIQRPERGRPRGARSTPPSSRTGSPTRSSRCPSASAS